MGERTSISWTDHTFNPWWGCTVVSPGCDHCYAETLDKQYGDPHWGKGVPRREFSDKHWDEPLKWNRMAKETGHNRLVFCASMADVMDDEAPAGARKRLWALIDKTPYLTWQLLTKRPHRYARYLPERFEHQNVWLGVSAEDQDYYDVRWPILRDVAEAKKLISFISYEPALGPLSIRNFTAVPSWIIFGGETGSGRRACKDIWAYVLKNECRIRNVSFFMKQMSARTPSLASLIVPEGLNVREFPR
jgi:protein gp37